MQDPIDRPDRCVVFDIETLSVPNIREIIGVEDDLATLRQMPVEALHDFCTTHEIKLGNRTKEEAIRNHAIAHIEKQIGKAALKPYGCQIFAIGCADLADGKPRVWAGRKELVILKAFVNLLSEAPAILAGFNIRGFDLGCLRARCLINSVALPNWFPEDERVDKYDRNNVFDARDLLPEGRLDIWLKAFGLPPKTASGSQVAEMSDDEVRQYCGEDVERERLLIRRLAPSVARLRRLSYKEVSV